MASYYVGNSAGNGDADAGDGIVLASAYLYHWIDGGNFGSVPPHNPRLKQDVVLTGSLPVTLGGPDSEVVVVVALPGSLRVDAVVTNATVESPAFLLNGIGIALFLDVPTLVVAPAVLGGLTLNTFRDLTRDFFADLYGIRPSFPWVIHTDQVEHYGAIVVAGSYSVELNEPFLVSALFQPEHDTVFASMGARANRIGMRIQDGSVEAIRFRDPEPGEVVIVAETNEVRRWDAQEGRWLSYSTLPERGFDGQLVLQLFDRDGVYGYVARLIGLCLAQWTYDTERLRAYVDTLKVPDDFVSLLAANFGLRVDNALPANQKRELIRQFIQIQKAKGSDQSFRRGLRTLGYLGYVNNVWVIPGGDHTQFIEKPIGYDVGPASPYYPASQVSVHLNELDGSRLQVIDDGIKQLVAEFLVSNVLPAHVRIRTFITDVSVSPSEGVTVSDSLVITTV